MTEDPKQARIVFMGTGDFGLPAFRRLLDEHYRVVLLVTQPERPQGRKQLLIPARIKQEAVDRGVDVYQPENVNAPESVARLRAAEPDLIVLAAYGQILSPEVLAVPRLGSLNIHASLLPHYRGAAPVNWAIYHGEKQTGVTIITMVPAVDAGDIVLQRAVPIGEEETAGELLERLAELAADMIPEAVDRFVRGELTPIPQPQGRFRRAPRLKKEHGRIDWHRPAAAIVCQVRAMNPWPGAFTFWHRDEKAPVRLIIWRARVVESPGTEPPGTIVETSPRLCVRAGDGGAVELIELQPAGRKVLATEEFVRGYRPRVGELLSGQPSLSR